MNPTRSLLAVILTSALCPGIASAASILVTPTSVTTNTTGDTFPAGNLINNSGLVAVPTIDNYSTTSQTAGLSDATKAWVTTDSGSDYFDAGTVPVLIFDLGGSYELASFVYWGYNNGGTRNEARSFTLAFSTTGVGGTFSGDQSFTQTSAIGLGNPGEFSLAPVTANAIRITITDNYYQSGQPGGDRVGLGEVKFTAVPEPSVAWLGGLGLIGLLRRRRS